jgi:hypothetical protein
MNFFLIHSIEKKEWGTVPDDWHGLDGKKVRWFKERGHELLKVDCGARGLILWDLRTAL